MNEPYLLPRSFFMRALITGFLRRLSESWPATAAMSDGNAGRLVFAVCAVAEKHETNVINKRDAVLFIALPRGFNSGPAIRWLLGRFLRWGRADLSTIPDYFIIRHPLEMSFEKIVGNSF